MKIIVGTLFSTLVLFSITSFADDTKSSNSSSTKNTSMHSKWVCTTNASSSDKKRDQEADKKMSEKTGSAEKSFAFASKHCRDCSKITCEVKQ